MVLLHINSDNEMKRKITVLIMGCKGHNKPSKESQDPSHIHLFALTQLNCVSKHKKRPEV